MKINKPKLNLSIDILMFMLMILIAGMGFLIKYVLVPGFKRNDLYGRNVELYYWGIDRHQWGTIHLILSFILLFLLLLHIVFHWRQIVGILKTMVPTKISRVILGSLLVLFTFIFGITPFFLRPEINENVLNHAHNNQIGKGYYSEELQHTNRTTTQPNIKNTQEYIYHGEHKKKQENSRYEHHSDIKIYGNMTINEVADKHNIPAQELANSINIPIGNNNKRLGRLRKRYNFRLSDLRDYIESKPIKK